MKRLAALLVCAACSSEGTPPDERAADPGPRVVRPDAGIAAPAPEPVALAVDPAELTLRGGADGPTATFAARATFADGRVEDVTARARFRLEDGALGRFEGAALLGAPDRGGRTRVLAELGALRASADLTVVLEVRSGEEAGFAGPAAPLRAPTIVYPQAGALLPPNVGGVELHFLPGAGNTRFEIALENRVTDVRVRVGCTEPTEGGCIYTPDPALWRAVAESNRGGEDLAVSVRGTDDAGTGVGASSPVTLRFARQNIEGAVYYWTTSNGSGIMRYDLGAGRGDRAERFLGTEHTGGTCVGCHALSRDGARMVSEAGGQHDGRLLLFDVAGARPMVPFGSTDRSIFESWSPDGAAFVGVYGDRGATDFNLQLFDGATGLRTASIPDTGTAEHPADHPDWSPDGRHIVFVEIGIAETLQRMYAGSLQVVTDLGGGAWSRPRELVPRAPGRNRYYPSFSPDGRFVIFDESICPDGDRHRDCNADSDPTARLWAVPAGGGQPVELARANAAGPTDEGVDLTTSFPRWSPFVFERAAEDDATVLWLTFSSTRRYGLRRPVAGGEENPRGSFIWMSAFDPDRAARGEDPSFAPFVLPFQDVATSNHIAQWTSRIAPPPG